MAIEILRPNAVGDLDGLYGSGWSAVDEDPADDETSMVWWGTFPATGSARDLYNLPASVGAGVIDKITIYARSKGENYFYPFTGGGNIILKTGGTVYESGYKGCPSASVWYDWSEEWSTNPNTGNPWTWAEIDALQIGIRLRGSWLSGYRHETYCTQVYVEVDFTLVVVPTVTTDPATEVT